MGLQAKEQLETALVVMIFAVVYVGLAVLMGVYLQWYILLGMLAINWILIDGLASNDPVGAYRFFWFSTPFWLIVGLGIYFSTDQTFVGDFLREHRHWVIR